MVSNWCCGNFFSSAFYVVTHLSSWYFDSSIRTCGFLLKQYLCQWNSHPVWHISWYQMHCRALIGSKPQCWVMYYFLKTFVIIQFSHTCTHKSTELPFGIKKKDNYCNCVIKWRKEDYIRRTINCKQKVLGSSLLLLKAIFLSYKNGTRQS